MLSESFHAGWRAELDGAGCEIVRVYGDFMGCRVDAGSHRVRFFFEPQSFRIGLQISLFGLFLSLVWFALSTRIWRFRVRPRGFPRNRVGVVLAAAPGARGLGRASRRC